MGYTAKKRSCIAQYKQYGFVKGVVMYQPCDERKDWSRGYIYHNKIEMKGICHLLHGASNGDQQPPAHDQVATSLLNPPRWTSPRERTPVVPFSAGPANESKISHCNMHSLIAGGHDGGDI